jgi:hypothetical protein
LARAPSRIFFGALIKYAIRVMGYRLTAKSLKAAIRHLCRYGDTDIFPRLPELAFFADEERHIITELSKLDLDSYPPGSAVEALAPKGRYSFRIAHQCSALDTLLLLACIIEIGKRLPTTATFSA